MKKPTVKDIQKVADKIFKATQNTKPYTMVVSSPIVAKVKKLNHNWTCDFSGGFDGDFINDLVVGKKVEVNCFGKCEFTVEHIDNTGKAYLRSNQTVVFADHLYDKKWKIQNNFYGLNIAKLNNMWFE